MTNMGTYDIGEYSVAFNVPESGSRHPGILHIMPRASRDELKLSNLRNAQIRWSSCSLDALDHLVNHDNHEKRSADTNLVYDRLALRNDDEGINFLYFFNRPQNFGEEANIYAAIIYSNGLPTSQLTDPFFVVYRDGRPTIAIIDEKKEVTDETSLSQLSGSIETELSELLKQVDIRYYFFNGNTLGFKFINPHQIFKPTDLEQRL